MTTEYALPMPAERLIPHRSPMRLVDTLLSRTDGGGVTDSRLPANAILADERGMLDEVTFVELIAQSYAAVRGYIDLIDGKPAAKGFLVGIRHLKITGKAISGDRLLTSIRTVGTFEGFAVIEGTVTRDAETVASGSIKVWLVEQGKDVGGNP